MATPGGVAVDASGNLYIADSANSRVRQVARPLTLVSTVAGGQENSPFCHHQGGPTGACLKPAESVAVDSAGSLYIANGGNNRVVKVTLGDTPTFTTVAGNGTAAFCGDGGDPLAACLNFPSGVAVDQSGNLYIADSDNSRIRRVTFGATPVITTVAGSGTSGFCGDGGNALSGCLADPRGLALDSADNLYIADTFNNRVRKVTFGATPVITTAAGVNACLWVPQGLTFDNLGRLYIADLENSRIRRIAFGSAPVIEAVAGNGVTVFCGDGLADNVCVDIPTAMASDSSGRLYVVSGGGVRVRRVSGIE